MKKLILVASLLMGLTTLSQAQNTNPPVGNPKKANRSPEDRAEMGAKRAAKELSLNADQTAKWEAAAKTRMEANAPLRDKMNGSTTPEERKTLHQQMKANNEAFDANVAGFLTPEQKTKYDQMKENKQNGRGAKGMRKAEGSPMQDNQTK